ncbi:biotin transporter BioY [Streptantibioticus cattleyicolor]|uniref:Biotin transporter n=1 Tax=Streptantibioticus cattleyicolor (strain ATCC 35852 / DSM 46488 / JCM 4925 / NBRC 14057 / NRRL 8057) TaxID=1003195 RepID=F8JJV0_STREN|nr:biotin transporter BioY [Streptantibioticus cattleyicolor]AEW98624.1 biotin transporter protein [Streptantibioticus cattleyicolor NRRL 8057 = DSM 46488]CCB72317.1 biotin transporter [Streptantibioticus cattleyicolor NRRL 8057 = DSM 46488]
MTGRGGRRHLETRDIVLIALFCAVIVALGLVPPLDVGIASVPITMQTLGVMLAGSVLGPVRGAGACALVVLLTIAGLPVLAGGRGGFGVIPGPTGGYLLGWIPGAFVTGLLVTVVAVRRRSCLGQRLATLAACLVGGILVVYALGVPWTAAVTGLSLRQSAVGALYYLPGDVAKAVVAALVSYQVRRSYPIERR